MLLITILTKNNPRELSHLLKSLLQNSALVSAQVLVVDDSDTDISRRALSKTCRSAKLKNLRLINSDSWGAIRTTHAQDVIANIALGSSTFNTFSTINVGSVIALTEFPNVTRVLLLDSDIELPVGFNPLNLSPRQLHGFRILGSPDLSRTQWIIFYIRSLLKRYRARQTFNRYSIVDTMVQRLSAKDSSGLLAVYTDLPVFQTDSSSTLVANIRFPTRGLDTNAMLIPTSLLRRLPFPNWWGQQFSWFNRLHLKKDQLSFSSKVLIHKAKKKHILDQITEYEVRGTILSAIYARTCKNLSEDLISKEIRVQLKLFERILGLVQVAKDIVSDKDELSQLYLIEKFVHMLQGSVLQLKKQDLLNELQSELGRVAAWRNFANLR